MTTVTRTRHAHLVSTLATVAAALLSAAAQADSPFAHPAVSTGAAVEGWQQARDAAPRLVGHPASPRWALERANGEHPAVLVARRASIGIDPNTFIVQPPAMVRWSTPDQDAIAVATSPQDR